MVHIPTWIDMLLLLGTFILTALQHRVVARPENTVLNLRYGLMVSCTILMVATTFLNRGANSISIGLFVASLLCLAAGIHLQRRMPPKAR